MAASEIYIASTDTDPAVRARAALARVQQGLLDRLAESAAPRPDADTARGELIDLCTGELRGYLAASYQTLYAAASGAAETRLLVRALRETASAITARIDALAAGNPSPAAVEALFAAHVDVERNVLLPALGELPGADLPALVADFETLLGGGRLDAPDVIDVREIPHGRRHPQIFTRFSRLAPGEAFILVNNHDPKPLRREFQATHPDAFTWDYVESGPEQWQVRIGRPDRADG
ncbi:DUF2249 domain-containing protein [Actinomadura chibensis]|uniref:DUF2249 domain-containing protein n=1 Tax=Actinomadura chibensis TaxID=392828 RepID=A0A5D0NY50_9ACTN|nr:DUF2249 domain-containing protein [Actinomadura chibensis]TYB48951.1 DUF2249 domain-containing protein [Actinomadura chibensis]